MKKFVFVLALGLMVPTLISPFNCWEIISYEKSEGAFPADLHNIKQLKIFGMPIYSKGDGLLDRKSHQRLHAPVYVFSAGLLIGFGLGRLQNCWFPKK
jgi:hypothetical protein